MTVATPLATRPIAPAPLIVHPVSPTEVSHPHGVLRRGQANGTSASSSTLLPSHPTATSSRSHEVSHVAHPHVAPYTVPSGASSASQPTLLPSNSNVDISNTALPSPHYVASHVSHTCVPPCAMRTSVSFTPSSTLPISHSTAHPMSACSFPPRRKRSRRCFVCGETGKHRLNPRFCPRTYELLSKHLAKFDANFRLVSDDGSPLPMTRHPGGVAVHLLSPRRLSPRTVRVAPRSVSKSPGTSQSNPPHVHRAPHATPTPVHHRIPSTVPFADKNPPHAPLAVVEHPHRISSPDRRFEANPLHFPHVERPSSPPFRILTPIHESLPRPKTPSKSTRYPDNTFILLLLDCLTLSPSWRRELAGLIDVINRLNLDDDIPALQKLMEPIRERYKTFVPSI